MTLLWSPKHKLMISLLALSTLVLGAGVTQASATTLARVLVGIGAVGGLFWWWNFRTREVSQGPASRLKVVSRTGLSPECSVALLDVEGRTFLVVYGKGYAEIREANWVSIPEKSLESRTGKGL